MHNAARYPFLPIDSALGEAGFQPRVPLTLTYQDQSGLPLPGWKRNPHRIEQQHTRANNPLERPVPLENVLAFLQCRPA
jgi:hypothetical protein